MCVLALKYFEGKGWVGAKNRDRSYKPDIIIKQSFRDEVERCLLWDKKTKWTEGINEYGVGIVNTTMKVAKDEKEGSKASEVRNDDSVFYSPGGKAVREALKEKTARAALEKLIELEMEGFCGVFSKDEAFILEAPIYVDNPDAPYEYKFIECDKKKIYVRTNHGILFPEAGYPIESDDETMVSSRKSSESRYKIAVRELKKAETPIAMIKALSAQPDENPQMNPLRTSETHGKHIMVTTGQILITSYNNTLHYRPVWCEIEFDFSKLNNEKTNTWFEIVSSRRLMDENFKTFKNYIKEKE